MDVIYYVRSSVLGGAVLTELKDDGGKALTKIYGTGGTIAEQRYTYPAAEQVIWLHQDRITQSFNTTTKTGLKFGLDDDGEFAAEFEPMGAVLPQEDPAFDPDLDPMPNLRRKQGGGDPFEPETGCLNNGVPGFDCFGLFRWVRSMGVTMLGGAVIDVRGDWMRTYHRYDNESEVGDSRVRAGDSYESGGGFLDFPFGKPFFMGTVTITPINLNDDVESIKDDIKKAKEMVKGDCGKNLADFLVGAFKKKFTPDDDSISFVRGEVLKMLFSNLLESTLTSSAVHRAGDVTDAIYNNRKVATFTRKDGNTFTDFGTKYFYDIHREDIVVNNGTRYSLRKRDGKERLYTVIHEGIHSLFAEFSDEFFAEYIKNGEIKETDKNAFDKGSKKLTDKIKELCP